MDVRCTVYILNKTMMINGDVRPREEFVHVELWLGQVPLSKFKPNRPIWTILKTMIYNFTLLYQMSFRLYN